MKISYHYPFIYCLQNFHFCPLPYGLYLLPPKFPLLPPTIWTLFTASKISTFAPYYWFLERWYVPHMIDFCFCRDVFLYGAEIQREINYLTSSTWFATSEASCQSCRTSQIVDFKLNFASIKKCRGNKNFLWLPSLSHLVLCYTLAGIVKRPGCSPARCRRGGSRGAEPSLLRKLFEFWIKKSIRKRNISKIWKIRKIQKI